MFELRMEITLQLCFVFARHCDVFLLRCNYVIYLFHVVTFELPLEITLQLRYIFACHCDVILSCHNDVILLRHNYVNYLFDVVMLRYILVRLNCAWKERYNYVSFLLVIVTYFLLRHNYVIYFFVLVTFFGDVRITLYFGTFELRMEIML